MSMGPYCTPWEIFASFLWKNAPAAIVSGRFLSKGFHEPPCAAAHRRGSLLVLSLLHAVFWRPLSWHREVANLSPLNGRVFIVHLFFIVFVLIALGLISLMRPDLLLAPSELGTLLLGGITVFWIARLLAQPLVFDAVMREGWTRSWMIRIGAMLLWLLYALIYGAAFLQQLRPGRNLWPR